MKVILVMLFAVASPLAFAGGESKDASNGCGLGWKVTSRMSLSASSTRGTTNSVSGGTFGTSSGTSGCDFHSIVHNNKKAIHFAEANYSNLLIEMAAGQGEYLGGFAATLECEHVLFNRTMRSNFESLLQKGSAPASLLNEVQYLIQTDPELQSHCSRSGS